MSEDAFQTANNFSDSAYDNFTSSSLKFANELTYGMSDGVTSNKVLLDLRSR